jgi:WD40 repeat protein
MHSFEMDPNIFLTGSDDVTCKMWDIRIPKPV